MSVEVPAKLKQADITRFALRAAQLQQVKPAVAYWCQYWIVNQILSKGLHNADAESLEYTTNMMDRLEQTKSENASNDAITDDAAGQAYVEQFAQGTFERAERAMQANKVTRQTADTFAAAATFFHLVNIWGPPDAETNQKILYAKFNATRILKALKEGKDPNDSNPRREEAPAEEALPALDPHDPEVQLLGGGVPPDPSGSGYYHATVEDAPDAGLSSPPLVAPAPISPPAQPFPHATLHPPAPVPPPQEVSAPTSPILQGSAPAQPDQVSPIAPADYASTAAPEGYFPPTPAVVGPSSPSLAPTPPPPMPPAGWNDDPRSLGPAGAPDSGAISAASTPGGGIQASFRLPGTIPSPGVAHNAAALRPMAGTPSAVDSPAPTPHHAFDFYHSPDAPGLGPPPVALPGPHLQQQQQQPQQPHTLPPPNPVQHVYPTRAAPPPQPQQPPTQTYYHQHQQHVPPPVIRQPLQQPVLQPPRPAQQEVYATDDASMATAQKHAKWAISALNFEDVPTAVKELRRALAELGAST